MCPLFMRLTAVELTAIALRALSSVVATWTCWAQLQSQPVASQQSGDPCVVVWASLPNMPVWWAARICVAEASWQEAANVRLEAVTVDGKAGTAAMVFCICNLVAAVARPDP